MGIIFYWAEGTKSDGGRESGCGVDFINSDSRMIRLFVKWCRECLNVPDSDLLFSIHIHKNSSERIEIVRKYWADQVGLDIRRFDKIYFKRHNPRTIRLKIGEDYYGSARVRVSASTNLNRKIKAWIDLICAQCGVV